MVKGKVMTEEELRAYVKRLQDASFHSTRAFAKDVGCSAAYLSDFYAGNRGAGPKLLRYLGVIKQSTYLKWRKEDEPDKE